MAKKHIILTILLLACGIANAAKRDSVVLRSNEGRLYIYNSMENVDWMSPITANYRLNVYYGSASNPKQIYRVSTDHKFRGWEKDTVTMTTEARQRVVMQPLVKSRENYPLVVHSTEAPLEEYFPGRAIIPQRAITSQRLYFTENDDIIGAITGDDGSVNVFYIDTRFKKGVVMGITSRDLGNSWLPPDISISDNLISFVSGTMTMNRHGNVYMILSDTDRNAYLTISSNKGATWSYPLRLSKTMNGSDHNIVFYRSGVYITYLSAATGDYMIWNGLVGELEDGIKSGNFDPLFKASDIATSNIRDVKILRVKGNRLVIGGRLTHLGTRMAVFYLYRCQFYL